MTSLLANPAEMIAKGAPRVIRNAEELEEYTAALFRLTALESPSEPELDASICSRCSSRATNASIMRSRRRPGSVVRFKQGLNQRDLIPQFGSESAVSMFLAGQRRLTGRQIQRLAARFQLPADVFMTVDRRA